MPPLTRRRHRDIERTRSAARQLPCDVLLRIFAKLTSDQKRLVVPLVCKHWAEVVRGPSPLWTDVLVDLRKRRPLRGGELARAEAWLAARAASLQQLCLRLPEEGSVLSYSAVHALASAAAEPLLRRLTVDYSETSCSEEEENAADVLIFLATLYGQPRIAEQLEALTICGVKGELLLGSLQRMLRGRMRLPRLRSFQLVFVHSGFSTPEWLPLQNAGLWLALLESSALEELAIAGPSTTGFASYSLPEELSRLDLSRLCLLDGGVSTFPDSLAAMTALRDLQVVDLYMPVRRYELPPSLVALTQLTRVELSCMALPIAIGTLPCLKQLTLWCLEYEARAEMNEDFEELLAGLRLESLALPFGQLGKLPPAIRAHTSLRSLDLHECDLRSLPAGPYLQRLTHLDLRNNLFKKTPAAALAAPRLLTLAMLGGKPPLQVQGSDGAELAAAVASVDAALTEMRKHTKEKALNEGDIGDLFIVQEENLRAAHEAALPLLA